MNPGVSGKCFQCGQILSSIEYGRKDSCPKCRADTHVCKNCVFYDPRFNNECTETQADRVVEKERSNFCDYFNPSAKGPAGEQKPNDLKSAAEALFKKKS